MNNLTQSLYMVHCNRKPLVKLTGKDDSMYVASTNYHRMLSKKANMKQIGLCGKYTNQNLPG